MPAGNEALHDEHMMLTALITNAFSLVAVMAMLITIRCAGEYVVVKQRLVLALGILTLIYTVFNTIEHCFGYFMKGEDLPDGIILGAYFGWWGLIAIETYLTGFLLWIMRRANRTESLSPIKLSGKAEIFGYLVVLVVATTAGLVAFFTIAKSCGEFSDMIKPGEDVVQDDDFTKDDILKCTATIRRSGWVYLSCLTFPLSLQAGLLYEVCKAHRGVNEGVEQLPGGGGGGDENVTGSVASFARQRVLTSIVKPLKWYPIVFLCASIAYLLWTLSMSPEAARGTTPIVVLPHTAGTGSALAFSLKGVLNSMVYFCSRPSKRRASRSCCATLCNSCRKAQATRAVMIVDDDAKLLQYGSSDSESEDEPDGLYGNSDIPIQSTDLPSSLPGRGVHRYSRDVDARRVQSAY